MEKSGATTMNKKQILSWTVVPALLVCGCSGMNHTEEGAVTGAAAGGLAGAVIGSAARAPGLGAAVGALTGAAVGTAVGHHQDQAERQAVAEAQRRALRIEDVVYMAQSHVSDLVIINQIRTTGSVYQLTASDIAYLKAQGVSDAVVSEMQATAARYPRQVYVAEPPPVAVGVGVGIRGRF
jgi:hypothetical protein